MAKNHRSGAGQPAPSRRARPVEYSILYTATLCLLAGGAVMVYSASSAESLLAGSGDPSYYLKRYVMFGLAGLVLLHAASRHGLQAIRSLTPILLVGSFVLTFAVMLPGVGVTVNGATRWLGAGPLQFQPSELLKVALVLYAAQLLAARPHVVATVGTLAKPLLVVVGAACLLLMKQPDMGTAMVICFAIGALLVAAGTPIRVLGTIGTTLAGLALLMALIALYGMIGYAGLRAAKLAGDLYSKLLAAGLTSLIMCQATLNIFAVLGMAPLTGVPLPFISYGSSNLIVMLAGMGLLMNVAAGERQPAQRGERGA